MAATMLQNADVPISSPFRVASQQRPSNNKPLPLALPFSRSPQPLTTFDISASTSTTSTTPEPSSSRPFQRLRSSLEQTLRTATRSRKTTNAESITTSSNSDKGKEKEKATPTSKDVPKEQARTRVLQRLPSKVTFRRGNREVATPSPIPPSGPILQVKAEGKHEKVRVAGFTSFQTPSMRQASISSPALHLSSQALPSPKSQSAVPVSSSSNNAALVSPARERSKKTDLTLSQREISPPFLLGSRREYRQDPVGTQNTITPQSKERLSRHRTTKSNPSVIPPSPSTPSLPPKYSNIHRSEERPSQIRLNRDLPSPPDTPTPLPASRSQFSQNSSRAASSTSHLPTTSTSGSPMIPARAASPIRARSPTIRPRVVSPSRLPPGASSPSRKPSLDQLRRSSAETPRRVSIETPLRGTDSPSPPRRRQTSPAQRSYAQNRHFNISSGSLLSLSSKIEHRELIRTAISMLCKEMIKPPPHMTRTESGIRDWEEVEVRLRALRRLERMWAKSGAVGSSGNVSASGGSGSGEERERRLFGEALRDGFVLCQLINKLRSSTVVRPDAREDGIFRASNVTKFLAACASYGLPNEELFQPDDLAGISSESLVRVAKTVIALINFVDTPLPERSKVISGQGQKPVPVPIPYQGSASRASASTPNLLPTAHSPSPSSPTRRRWSPPSTLPPLRSNSSEEDTSDTTPKESDAGRASSSSPVGDDDPSMVLLDVNPSPVPRFISPPPRSALRPRATRRAEDSRSSNGRVESPQPEVADSKYLSVSAPSDSIVELQYSRQSVASSAMTETTVTTVLSSILDTNLRGSGLNKFGTIRTVTTDFTSEAPSLSRTEGSFIADDMARRKSSDGGSKFVRDRKLSETVPIDLTRVAEETDESVSSKDNVSSYARNKPQVSSPERLERPHVHLHKGKWPDDFMGAFNLEVPAPISNPTPSMEYDGETQLSVPPITSPSRKPSPLGLSRRDTHLETLPELPRKTHRPRHSADNPILVPKESIFRRDTSPDAIPATKAMLRRHSTKPRVGQQNGMYYHSNDSESPPDADADTSVPFPRAPSRERGPGSSTPGVDIVAISDRPRFPRGRFQSDVEDARRRLRPSVDELNGRPRSRIESMVSLGVTSNASASDLLRRESMDGSGVRKTIIITEEGKSPVQFQLGNCIGRGQFGSVYRALNLSTGQTVAVKQIRLEGLKEDEVSELMREVNLYKRLSHPGIVKYEGMARDEETLSIVLEYAENGSLGQTLKAFGKLNERLVASYVVKILEGLHYLHGEDVVHCDLKAANILTTKTGNVKLTDFGVSLNLRAMEREIKNVAGTPNWMAPEIIELKGASSKSDIWSLACTVVELLTGRPPYAEISNSMTVMFRIVEDNIPPIPEDCSELAKDFLLLCFDKNPELRPSAEILFEHPWLKQNWGAFKELRPQDSIPFLRRVSADLQRSDAVRLLAQMDMPEPSPKEDVEHPESTVQSPPAEQRFSTKSVRPPGDSEFVPREHSFVKTTFSKPMRCRVCLTDVKKSAVICSQCSLISHSKCAPHAPPTCDLRAQLLLYAQYAEKTNPASVYHNPADALNGRPPVAMSDIPYVLHSPRTSLDTHPQSVPPPPTSHPPTAFKLMSAFKRSRSNLVADSTPSSPPVTSQTSSGDDKVIRRKTAFSRNKERRYSNTSNSTGVSSLRSAATAAESISSGPGTRKSHMSTSSADYSTRRPNDGPKMSRTRNISGLSEVTTMEDSTKSDVIPLLPDRRKHRNTDSKSSNCVVQ
ncbi:hypothetical protein AMATHDRAFT_58237 [Amanita thiersii Skay4041]|uniref:Protein kinase domain-containing protein n=1 Tax=Amanita thiersii Skay4041 TaxID=703135 RepID=A0A2A9NTY9_9AGAR|nr:hypothetical protein AMATHDRAFT_58237 [Amanita thiersii Skay4041]